MVHVSMVEDGQERLLMSDVTKTGIHFESMLNVSLSEWIALLVEVDLCNLEIELGGVGADLKCREEESTVIFPIQIA